MSECKSKVDPSTVVTVLDEYRQAKRLERRRISDATRLARAEVLRAQIANSALIYFSQLGETQKVLTLLQSDELKTLNADTVQSAVDYAVSNNYGAIAEALIETAKVRSIAWSNEELNDLSNLKTPARRISSATLVYVSINMDSFDTFNILLSQGANIQTSHLWRVWDNAENLKHPVEMATAILSRLSVRAFHEKYRQHMVQIARDNPQNPVSVVIIDYAETHPQPAPHTTFWKRLREWTPHPRIA